MFFWCNYISDLNSALVFIFIAKKKNKPTLVEGSLCAPKFATLKRKRLKMVGKVW